MDVDDLARLVGWEGQGVRGVDWSYVESELGLVLPVDYKALVERFPHGAFNDVLRIIQPRSPSSEYVEEFIDEVFRSAFDVEELTTKPGRSFPFELFRPPYPVFPRAPGIFPWAIIEAENIACSYLTGQPDLDKQAPGYVVRYAAGLFTELEGSITNCVVNMITGDVPKMRALLSTDQPPRFGPWPMPAPAAQQTKATRDESRPLWPSGPGLDIRSAGFPVPTDQVDDLVDFGLDARNAQRVDWAVVEHQLGLRLPGDYKRFIETFGPGWYADVLVASPTGPIGDIPGVLDVMDDLRQELDDRYFNPPPVWPDPGGPLAWGRTLGGDFCGWQSDDFPADPDTWQAMQFNSAGGTWIQRFSMTGYLNDYLRADERSPQGLVGGFGAARSRWKRWRHKLAPGTTGAE